MSVVRSLSRHRNLQRLGSSQTPPRPQPAAGFQIRKSRRLSPPRQVSPPWLRSDVAHDRKPQARYQRTTGHFLSKAFENRDRLYVRVCRSLRCRPPRRLPCHRSRHSRDRNTCQPHGQARCRGDCGPCRADHRHAREPRLLTHRALRLQSYLRGLHSDDRQHQETRLRTCGLRIRPRRGRRRTASSRTSRFQKVGKA